MSTLTANLKHFYQRPGMWLVYLFVAALSLNNIFLLDKVHAMESIRPGTVPLVMARMTGWFLAFYILVISNFAVYAGSLQMDILNKPAFYILPAHRYISRQVILIAGIVLNLIEAGLIAPTLCGSPGRFISVFGSFFFLGLSVYLINILLLFYGSASKAIPIFLYAILFFFSSVSNALLGTVLHHSMVWVVLGMTLTVFVWYWLGRPEFVRGVASTPLLSGFDLFNKEKVKRFKLTAGTGTWGIRYLTNWISSFFLGRMAGATPFSFQRNVWGLLYFYASKIRSGMVGIIILYIGLWLFCLYIGGEKVWSDNSVVFLFLVASFVMGANLHIPFYLPLPLPLGRSWRFTSTLAGLGILCLLATAVLLSVAGFSSLLRIWLPEITLGGKRLVMGPVPYLFTLSPLILFPICFIAETLFPRVTLLNVVPGFLILFIFLVLPYLAFGTLWAYLFFIPPAWGLLAYALWWFFRKKGLVRVGQ